MQEMAVKKTKRSSVKLAVGRGKTSKKSSRTKAAAKAKPKSNVKSLPLPVLQTFQSRLSKLTKPNFSAVRSNVKISRKVGVIAGGVIVALAVLFFAANKLTIAWVDNHPISWFEYYSTLDSKYGPDLKSQMISQQLVLDEADRRHTTVSDQEVNNEINTIKSQSGGDANFNSLLTQQGLTMAELQKQVKLQLLIQKMFSQEASVSADEVTKYIKDNKDQYPTDDASTEAQVRQQLQQQKLVDVFRTWLQQAQSSNRVIKTGS